MIENPFGRRRRFVLHFDVKAWREEFRRTFHERLPIQGPASWTFPRPEGK